MSRIHILKFLYSKNKLKRNKYKPRLALLYVIAKSANKISSDVRIEQTLQYVEHHIMQQILLLVRTKLYKCQMLHDFVSFSCQTIITPHNLLVPHKFVESHYCLSHSSNHQKTIFSSHHLLQLRHLITERVAVKIIDKGKLDSKTHRMVSREIQITDALSHPHLIRFVSPVSSYYVMSSML